MAKIPTPKIKERVKVQILPSTDAKEEVELDYRLFITGNYSHSEPGAHKDGDGTLKERRVREIKNKRDFKTVLEDINPQLKLMVPNKLSDEKDAEMEINLDIKHIKDFHPDEIAKQVEPLQKMLDARNKLKQLKMQVLRDVKLRKALEGVLQGGGSDIDDLVSKLAPAEEKPDKEKEK